MSSLLTRVERTRRAHDRLTKEASSLGVDLRSLSLSEQYTLAMELYPPSTKIASAAFVQKAWEAMGASVAHTVQGVAHEKQANPTDRYLANMSGGAALGGTLGAVVGGSMSDDPALGATAGALLGAGSGGHLGALRARIAEAGLVNEPTAVSKFWKNVKGKLTNPLNVAAAGGMVGGGVLGGIYSSLAHSASNKAVMDALAAAKKGATVP